MYDMPLQIRYLGLQPYTDCYAAMQQFTYQRESNTPDEVWLLQHPALFTRGKASRPEHFLQPTTLPIIETNRGGKVTYHAPGQLIGYCLIDMARRHMSIRQLVQFIEQALLKLLTDYHIPAYQIVGQPGLYVEQKKIAALGLRVHKGRSYHGFSLNVNMDLTPFSWIVPCGLANVEVTQMADWQCEQTCDQIATEVAAILQQQISDLPKKGVKPLALAMGI